MRQLTYRTRPRPSQIGRRVRRIAYRPWANGRVSLTDTPMSRLLRPSASALALTESSLMAVTAAPPLMHAQSGAPKHAEARNRVGTARPTDTLSVGMRDGSSFMGRVVSVRGDTAEMTTSVGTVRLALQDVTRS